VANRFLYLVRHGEAIENGELSLVGQLQARLVGERLRAVPLSVIDHSPLLRAESTARLISESLPRVPLHASELVGDYVPAVPSRLPAVYADFLAGVTAEEIRHGAAHAAAAIDRYARPAETETHELVVTHNFLIGWFVQHALEAPPGRWLGLNQCNGALTVILYRPDRPPVLVTFNDMGHLPPRLRWTGFPPGMRF
jgi:serine/threonine-protein phosphatase PGAM5